MKIAPHEIHATLHAMLHRAGRHDLIASGFEIDDTTLARSRALTKDPHHAVYHALFDKGAPHAAAINPPAPAPPPIPPPSPIAYCAAPRSRPQVVQWIQTLLLLLILLTLLASRAHCQAQDPLIVGAKAAGSVVAGSVRESGIYYLDCGPSTTFAGNTIQCPGTSSGSSAVTTTLNLEMGGQNNNGSGQYPAWDVDGGATSTKFNGAVVGVSFASTGTPTATHAFLWPSNWDNTTTINVIIQWTGLYDDSNNMQFTAAFACPTTTLNYTGLLSYGAASNSSVLTNSSYYYTTKISGVSPNSCTAGTMGVLQIGRNNSVTGTNSSDPLAMVAVGIQWTSH